MNSVPTGVIIGTAKAGEVPGWFLRYVGRPLLLGNAYALGVSDNDLIEQLAAVVVGLLRAFWVSWQADRALVRIGFRVTCRLHT